jgi:hypothetical protein
MSIVDSPCYTKLVYKKTIALGDLYFFKNFLVCEFIEGLDINFDNFGETKTEIDKHFGTQDFGLIGNRLQSYSITLTDAPLFNDTFKNLKAYATVTYTDMASKVSEIENYFFSFNKQDFNDLEDAIQWVKHNLEETTAV